jgi:hypothetical protein
MDILKRVLLVACLIAPTVAAASPAASGAEPCNPLHGRFRYMRALPEQSELIWEARYTCNVDPDYERVKGVRAGSGNGTRDECAKGSGWLPPGTYDLRSHADNYNGSVIWGRVWHLQDKKCASGVMRTELFIHTEETRTQGQAGCLTGPNADGPQCWEGPQDYLSAGCIKVAHPTDIADAHYVFHNHGGPSTHGTSHPSILLVEDGVTAPVEPCLDCPVKLGG